MFVGRDDIRPSPRLGWLVVAFPAQAKRFRAGDPELAAFLTAAGAEVVAADPDVEIGAPDQLEGDASCAVVLVRASESSRAAPRALRAARRLSGSVALRVRVAEARRALQRRGYRHVVVAGWERHVSLGRDLSLRLDHSKPWQRFPLRAAVVGRRELGRPTAVDAAVAAAADSLGRRPEPSVLVLGSSGIVLAAFEDAIVRVSVGPAARQIEGQRVALDALASVSPGPTVRDRVPWLLGYGRVGLATWSLERRFPGAVPPADLPATLVEDCLDFLAALHQTGVTTHEDRAVVERVDELAAWCGGETGRRLAGLRRRFEQELAGLPRGFGHGDFWAGNLLAENGRLQGVVDWPSAGPNRLPMLDLFHLRVNAVREASGREVGDVIVEEVMPRVREGGDALDRAYLRRLGLELSARELEALLGAYWLVEIGHDLLSPDRDPRRVEAPRWRRRNVESVIAAFGG